MYQKTKNRLIASLWALVQIFITSMSLLSNDNNRFTNITAALKVKALPNPVCLCAGTSRVVFVARLNLISIISNQYLQLYFFALDAISKYVHYKSNTGAQLISNTALRSISYVSHFILLYSSQQ